MSDITKEQVVTFIENMTVLELAAFVKELEEKFGVSAAAPVGAVAAAGPAAGRPPRSSRPSSTSSSRASAPRRSRSSRRSAR